MGWEKQEQRVTKMQDESYCCCAVLVVVSITVKSEGWPRRKIKRTADVAVAAAVYLGSCFHRGVFHPAFETKG